MTLNDRQPNFRSNDGRLYLVRCFNCGLTYNRGKENWAPAVATGRCAWCGWEEEGKFIRIEYDETFFGGNYSGVGNFFYMGYELPELNPNDSIEELFEKITDINKKHVVFYTVDELYNGKGELVPCHISDA